MLTPESIDDVQEAVRSADRVQVRGAGTKSALSRGATVSTERLSGILDYEPSEYTFTALAGTPLSEIRNTLAENGQFLPFDPPFVETGATLGGTAAAGLSGPGRFRYGGVRDFFLGVRLVTGEGRIVFGGGKVVKNAAGFDIPKLMTGSSGRLGIMTELTFKVFPVPETWTTVSAEFSSLQKSCDAMLRMAMSQEELYCLDFAPPGRLLLRMGGLEPAVPVRTERLHRLLRDSDPDVDVRTLHDDAEAEVWSDAREFRWLSSDDRLVKVPLSPAQVPLAEKVLEASGTPLPRRYSVGGNVLWLGLPQARGDDLLDRLCSELNRPALGLTGQWDEPQRGLRQGRVFEDRLRSVFDPESKLLTATGAAY